MITRREIEQLKNNDGLTLKKYNAIAYKTGYQVATEGVEVSTIDECMNAIKQYEGNCGVWFSDGIYYVDKSKRVNTKREALTLGKMFNQISVLGWANMNLIYC